MESVVYLGLILVLIGIFLVIVGSVISSSGKSETKVGIGGFIGPFVFGFGNDPKMIKFASIIAVIAAIVFLFFLFLR